MARIHADDVREWIDLGRVVAPVARQAFGQVPNSSPASSVGQSLLRITGRAAIGGFGVYVFMGERDVKKIALRSLAAMTMIEVFNLVFSVLGRKDGRI